MSDFFGAVRVPQEYAEMTEAQKAWIIDTYGLDTLQNWHEPEMQAIALDLIVGLKMHTPDLLQKAESECKAWEDQRLKDERIQQAQKLIDTGIPYMLTNQHQPINPEYWPAGFFEAKRYLHEFRHGNIYDLFLHGQSRTGKSRLAAYMLEELTFSGFSCVWVNCLQLQNDFENGIIDKKLKQAALQTVNRAKQAAVLVLDDIAKPETKEDDGVTPSYFGRQLYDILEHRSTTPHCATITTSEWAPGSPELRSRLTAAIYGRLFQRATILNQESKVPYTVWHNQNATAKYTQENKGFLGQNTAPQNSTPIAGQTEFALTTNRREVYA